MQKGIPPATAGAALVAQAAPNAIKAKTAVRMLSADRFASIAGIGIIAWGWPAFAVAAGFAAASKERIGDAVQTSAGCGGQTLLVAREGAIAQTGRFIALQAKRIAAAHGLGRREARQRQSARGQQGQKDVAHEVPPDQPCFDSLIATQAGPQGSRQLTFVRSGPAKVQRRTNLTIC